MVQDLLQAIIPDVHTWSHSQCLHVKQSSACQHAHVGVDELHAPLKEPTLQEPAEQRFYITTESLTHFGLRLLATTSLQVTCMFSLHSNNDYFTQTHIIWVCALLSHLQLSWPSEIWRALPAQALQWAVENYDRGLDNGDDDGVQLLTAVSRLAVEHVQQARKERQQLEKAHQQLQQDHKQLQKQVVDLQATVAAMGSQLQALQQHLQQEKSSG